MSWSTRRKKPYLQESIHRLQCVRCGKPAEFQWQICSDGNNYRPICRSCDIELNNVVLMFMGHPDRGALMIDYRKKVDGNGK